MGCDLVVDLCRQATGGGALLRDDPPGRRQVARRTCRQQVKLELHARLEREQKILQKDVIAVDLRMADRVVVRLTEEAMAARLEGLKKKPLRGKGVDT